MQRFLQRYWLVISLGLVMIGSAIWLSQKVTFYEERIDLGPSPQARSNPYLALQYFLSEQEIKVTTIDSLVNLMTPASEQQSLFLLSHDSALIDSQQSRLLDWVAQGGHLIISAQHEQLEQDTDSLLASLGIQKQLSSTLEDLILEQEISETSPATSPNDDNALTRLYLENELSPAYLALDNRYHLFDSENRAYAWANSENTTQLLQLPYEHGLITVLVDFQLWNNKKIDQYDHAWLAWYLSQDSEVLLFRPTQQQGLLSLLWQYYPIACLLLLALLLLTAWAKALRFGPLIPVSQHSRRKLTEHLQAAAHFELRHNGQRSLLLALQKDIQQRAQQRYPNFSRLAVSEQWQVLQQLSCQPSALIAQSMRPPLASKLSAQAFTQQVMRLQQLRNAL